MILGTKQVQEMLKLIFWTLEITDERCTEKYKWDEFKKQFLHGKMYGYSQDDYEGLKGVVSRKWVGWCLKISETERERLTNELMPLLFTCYFCGEKKEKDEFSYLARKEIHTDYGYITVYDGTGQCTECLETLKAKRKLKREEHKKELRRQWYQAHKEEISAKKKQNRESINEAKRKYEKTHRDQINQYISERKANDPVYRLKCQARNTIYQSFIRTGNVKQERCENLTGLPLDAFVEYLLKTYQKNYGIPWDGKEAVHVDHIIPLATASNEEDVIRLCNYTNLQLLKAMDNIRKSDRLDFQLEGT